MTTSHALTRDKRLDKMTIDQLEAEAKVVEEQIHDAEKVLEALRFRRCDIADQAIRVQRAYRIAQWAKFMGITFQALRPQLARFWDRFAPDFNPDDRPQLTRADELTIRRRYQRYVNGENPGDSKSGLAAQYGVAPATIKRIVETPPAIVAEPRMAERTRAAKAKLAAKLAEDPTADARAEAAESADA